MDPILRQRDHHENPADQILLMMVHFQPSGNTSRVVCVAGMSVSGGEVLL